MSKYVLILDLDGVLITSPSWKSDELDSDGYSKFNENCVRNLNQLLSKYDFEIWLSSTRRTVKKIGEFNEIFSRRNIITPIVGFVPNYLNCKTRRNEIEKFVKEYQISRYLIVDDDKSLNGLESEQKTNLILTEFHKGFDSEKLEQAIQIMELLATKNSIQILVFNIKHPKHGIFKKRHQERREVDYKSIWRIGQGVGLFCEKRRIY